MNIDVLANILKYKNTKPIYYWKKLNFNAFVYQSYLGGYSWNYIAYYAWKYSRLSKELVGGEKDYYEEKPREQ